MPGKAPLADKIVGRESSRPPFHRHFRRPVNQYFQPQGKGTQGSKNGLWKEACEG